MKNVNRLMFHSSLKKQTLKLLLVVQAAYQEHQDLSVVQNQFQFALMRFSNVRVTVASWRKPCGATNLLDIEILIAEAPGTSQGLTKWVRTKSEVKGLPKINIFTFYLVFNSNWQDSEKSVF